MGRKRGDSVMAGDNSLGATKEWRVEFLPGHGQGRGAWALKNAYTNCVLNHYGGKSIQCYAPGSEDPHTQWKIIEVNEDILS